MRREGKERDSMLTLLEGVLKHIEFAQEEASALEHGRIADSLGPAAHQLRDRIRREKAKGKKR